MKKFEIVYFETPKLNCVIKKHNQPSLLLFLGSIEEIEALEETLSKVKEYFKDQNLKLLENKKA